MVKLSATMPSGALDEPRRLDLPRLPVDDDVGAAVGVRGVAQHRLLDDGADTALVAGCLRCGEDTNRIDIGHGVSDYGVKALANILLSEAVIALGHVLPFSPLRSRIAIP